MTGLQRIVMEALASGRQLDPQSVNAVVRQRTANCLEHREFKHMDCSPISQGSGQPQHFPSAGSGAIQA